MKKVAPPMKSARHFVVRWGGWMFQNWHLYRWTPHQAASGKPIHWHDWDRVL